MVLVSRMEAQDSTSGHLLQLLRNKLLLIGVVTACPCIHALGNEPPNFVGDDYFCDSGQQQYIRDQPLQFFSADPLWDGAGCGSGNACCTFNTPPWFHKQLPASTTDDIEMRVCRDEANDNEDIALQIVEIFVH